MFKENLNNVVRQGVFLLLVTSSIQAQKVTPLAPQAAPQISREQARGQRLEKLVAEQAAATEKLLADTENMQELRMVVHSPFIIAGNYSREKLTSFYTDLIQPSAAALGRMYFANKPDTPIVVWLFSNAEDYSSNAARIYGDKNVSVYGYYKPDKRALVMNLATGGGTLIHELTHALAVYDFPGQPDWFNEGLASLYEQSTWIGRGEQQQLVGMVNWRLPKLQEAITAKQLPPLTTLMKSDDFRGAAMGRNYAQARYLCMFLQEQGKLGEFYRRYRDNRLNDPHGVAALEKTLGTAAMTTLDADYQNWVMALKR
jgi:hypothetical protein